MGKTKELYRIYEQSQYPYGKIGYAPPVKERLQGVERYLHELAEVVRAHESLAQYYNELPMGDKKRLDYYLEGSRLTSPIKASQVFYSAGRKLLNEKHWI